MSYQQTEEAVYRYGNQLTIDYTPVSDDVAAGTVVDLGTFAGIALEKIVAGQTGVLCVRGVFDILKAEGISIDLGDIVLWDASNRRAYFGSIGYTDDLCLGKCFKDAAVGDLTVLVSVIETAATAGG